MNELEVQSWPFRCLNAIGREKNGKESESSKQVLCVSHLAIMDSAFQQNHRLYWKDCGLQSQPE